MIRFKNRCQYIGSHSTTSDLVTTPKRIILPVEF